MKRKLTAVLSLALFSLASCSLTRNISGGETPSSAVKAENKYEVETEAISDETENYADLETAYLDVKIFQTLNENEALAFKESFASQYHTGVKSYYGDTVVVISFEEMLYDGKTMEGSFVLLSTYRYETKGGDIKTVPVYIRSSEFDEVAAIFKESLSTPNPKQYVEDKLNALINDE